MDGPTCEGTEGCLQLTARMNLRSLDLNSANTSLEVHPSPFEPLDKTTAQLTLCETLTQMTRLSHARLLTHKNCKLTNVHLF
jgi:hypothetical protein